MIHTICHNNPKTNPMSGPCSKFYLVICFHLCKAFDFPCSFQDLNPSTFCKCRKHAIQQVHHGRSKRFSISLIMVANRQLKAGETWIRSLNFHFGPLFYRIQLAKQSIGFAKHFFFFASELSLFVVRSMIQQ